MRRVHSAHAATLARLIYRSKPFTEAEATTIVNKVRAAMQCMREGVADFDDFIRLGAAINVSAARAEKIGSADDVQQVLTDAGAAMTACQLRHERTGRLGMTGPELTALATGIDAYEAILRASSPLQMHQAEQEVLRRLNALGLNDNPEAGRAKPETTGAP